MNKFVLIAMPVLAIIVGTMAITSAYASIVGDFGIGYQQGKVDAYDGYSESCPSGYSNSYCTGYHVGYEAEAAVLNQAQP
jgi:hypothetical protein